jgi:D-psicose/D-tagatose/L-ribulose 3-epimerase
MKFGVNLLLFGDVVDRRMVAKFAMIRDLGFDGVEVPVFDPGAVDVDLIRRFAENNSLDLTTSGALPPDADFYTTAARRKAARKYVRAAVQVAADLGASVLCGPLYKAVGDTDSSETLAVQRRETAKEFRPLADFAHAVGVTLAFEPLNRFETNFLNTTADAVRFAKSVKSPGAGLLLDTFHMHIEEKDTAAAIRQAGKAGMIAHFHAAENDRGTAGSGQVAWEVSAKALRGARYNKWVMLETFSQSNQAIRKAVSCWRPFYKSVNEFLTHGLPFVRKTFDPKHK